MDEEQRLKAIIHHMTLMLSDFGHHEPECHCSFEKTPHAVDCADCECGLREAIEFGVEQSGLSLEPPEATPEEEARLHEIGMRAVEEALQASRPAPPAPTTEPGEATSGSMEAARAYLLEGTALIGLDDVLRLARFHSQARAEGERAGLEKAAQRIEHMEADSHRPDGLSFRQWFAREIRAIGGKA